MGYTREELDKAYMGLEHKQKYVLDNLVRRGMKTEWLNAWAKKKGLVLTKEQLSDPDVSMDILLDWVLLDYQDFLVRKKEVKCECGRSLRYRYRVLHKETGQIYDLGRVHFQQHTGLSPEIVRDITRGLTTIDLERDEILTKVIDAWVIPFVIPNDITIPDDVLLLINVSLPLLDRQINRIEKLIIKKKFPIQKRKPLNNSKNMKTIDKGKPLKVCNDIEQISLFNREYSDVAGEVGESKQLNDLQELYEKLKYKKITSEESERLYRILYNKPAMIKEISITPATLKESAISALGHISNKETRKWIGEIRRIKYNT